MNKRQLFDERFLNPDRGFGSIARNDKSTSEVVCPSKRLSIERATSRLGRAEHPTRQRPLLEGDSIVK